MAIYYGIRKYIHEKYHTWILKPGKTQPAYLPTHFLQYHLLDLTFVLKSRAGTRLCAG